MPTNLNDVTQIRRHYVLQKSYVTGQIEDYVVNSNKHNNYVMKVDNRDRDPGTSELVTSWWGWGGGHRVSSSTIAARRLWLEVVY